MDISRDNPRRTVLLEPFVKLVKLIARAFYDDYTTKVDNQPKSGRSDNKGIAVVVLDALTRRQWVREEDLAKELKIHSKQLRRILRFFEEEKLVTRDHRKETAKGAKNYSAAVAATADGLGKFGEEKVKLHTHSYCCLDYAQTYDVVRYRLHRMKKKIKDELDDKNTVQEYVCPNCKRRYNALDALRLISFEDEYFHCENCNSELVAENDNKLPSQEVVDGDDNARRRRREKLKDMLQKMEVQLAPLMEQINRVKDLKVPEFGTLQAWEAHAAAVARRGNGAGSNDPSKSSQDMGYGTPMPFLGETKVEVNMFDGKENDTKSENTSAPDKVLPPWMIKKGMVLTKEQLGEVKQETKMDSTKSGAVQFSDDKKSNMENNDVKNIQDEYYKAYYAALLKKQQELAESGNGEPESSSNGPSDMSSNRQVGKKSKFDEFKEEEVEWEEDIPVAGNTSVNYKVDLNVEADAMVEEEEEDDIDWEEG